METRILGKTGLRVSVLSFGCGAVGGLMVKGAVADQERAVARAMEFGINYFDTAPMYGDGESERHLGRVLKALKRPKVYVGTKVWLEGSGDVGGQPRQEASAVADAEEVRRGGGEPAHGFGQRQDFAFANPGADQVVRIARVAQHIHVGTGVAEADQDRGIARPAPKMALC